MSREACVSLLMLREAKKPQAFDKWQPKQRKFATVRMLRGDLKALIRRRMLASSKKLPGQAPPTSIVILQRQRNCQILELAQPKPVDAAPVGHHRRSLSANGGHSFPLPLQTPIASVTGIVAATELMATERDYLMQLRLCLLVYMRDFRQPGTQQRLDCNEAELFGNWASIEHFHRTIVRPRLQIAAPSGPFPVAHLFLCLAPLLRRLYLPYLELRGRQTGLFFQSAAIREWAKEVTDRHGLGPAQSLDALLIRPIQRLVQLAILLERLKCPSGDLFTQSVRARAVAAVRAIPRLANDRLHLQRLLLTCPGQELRRRVPPLALLGQLLCSEQFQLKANVRAAKMLLHIGRCGSRRLPNCRAFLFRRGLLLAYGNEQKSRPLARLVRIGWEGGLEFWLFLRCGGTAGTSRCSSRRRLGKIYLQAASEAIAQEWMRRLGTYVRTFHIARLFLPQSLIPPQSANPSDARESAFFRPSLHVWLSPLLVVILPPTSISNCRLAVQFSGRILLIKDRSSPKKNPKLSVFHLQKWLLSTMQ